MIKSTRYFNTLHGFQEANGRYIVAAVPEELNMEKCTERIIQDTGVCVVFSDYLGRVFLEVPEADYSKIQVVLDALLDMMAVDQVDPLPDVPDYAGTFRGGFDVICSRSIEEAKMFGLRIVSTEGHICTKMPSPYQPWIRLHTRLKPMYPGGTRVGPVQSEVFALKELAEADKYFRGCRNPDVTEQHENEDLWCTKEGKEYARSFVKAWQHPAPKCESEFAAGGWYTRYIVASGGADNPLIDYPLCRVGEPLTDMACEEIPDDCMICLDAIPDTMVLPCMHVVVCKSCSMELANTPHKETCVKCRRSITTVLYDEQ